MKHLTIIVIILMIGFGACKKSETAKEPQKQNISNENQSELFSRTMYVNAEAGIRRRSEPSLDSIRIGAYSHGEKIEVIERTGTPATIDGITDYWYKTKANITFEGKLYEYSWVFGGYLSESKPEIKRVQGKQTINEGYSGELSFDKITYDSNSKIYTITGRAAKFITAETESGAPLYEYGQTVSVFLPSGTQIRSHHAGGVVTIDRIYNDHQRGYSDFEFYPFIYNTKNKTLENIGN